MGHIMVIDDSETDRQWMVDALGKEHEVEVGVNWVDAMHMMNAKFDLYLFDVKLPGLSGDEIANVLKQDKDKVVLISALSAEELQKKVEAVGARGFICKASARDNILERVNKFLAQD